MKERLIRFMQGRYGTDGLSRFLLIVGLILLILAMVIREPDFLSLAVYMLGLVVIIWSYFRIFSRNTSRRYAENIKYCQMVNRFKRFFGKEKYMLEQRRDYRIFTCPGCKQKIRIPKGKGKIEISCPKCHTKFVKKA